MPPPLTLNHPDELSRPETADGERLPEYEPGEDQEKHFYQDDPGPPIHTLPPYLTLRPQLLLCLFSPFILSLLFTCIHLTLNSSDIKANIAHGKRDLLAACARAEDRMSIIASMPRYIAQHANRGTDQAVEDIVRGLGRILTLIIVALEAILVFFVNSYRSLFLW